MIKIDGKASKDLDREVLLRMNDRDLLTICQVNKYFNEEVCNDQFFHTRLLQKYPDTVRAKPYNRSYKNYYLDVVYNISILKDNFFYEYTGGNPMIQVEVFNSFPVGADWDELFVASVEAGELTMVDFFLKNGADINTSAGLALNYASLHGDLKLVKYLVEKGANIDIEPFVATPLGEAVQGRHLEVVKYLIEKGVNVNANNKQALKYAIALNNLEIVKYLAEHGADFYSNNNWGLRFSEEINSRKAITDYLLSSAK